MKVLKSDYRLWLSVMILMTAFMVSYLAFAQDSFDAGPTEKKIAAKGIAFPVAELGNCANKGECKKYCEDSANIPACISFAKRHGLMNEEEAEKAQNFSQAIRTGGGPGGCQNPRECETFCRNIDNMEACIAFAEQHNIKDKHIDQGRRVLNYIKSGGEMPGGCNSKESCDAYCGDFSHAEECYNFAKRSGILQEGKRGEFAEREGFEGGLPSPEQFQKFLELAKRGETPGGCKSKDACESYCRDQAHFEECIAFGEKMGFMSSEQAAMIRKTGGKGPGGCDSPRSCEAYCNDPANQESCFRFAEEHGFIGKEELHRAKEGFVRLRQGLEQAPPEVAACLKSVVGENVLDDIQAGRLVPGPQIGERVRQCFMRHGGEVNPNRPFQDAPEEAKSCLREKLGDNFDKIQKGESFPTPEMADTFRICFQQFEFSRRGGEGFEGREGFGPPGGGMIGPPPHMIQDFLRGAPPGIAECLKEKLGDELEKIKSGEALPSPEIGEKMRSCFESFRPPEQRFNEERGEFERFGPPPQRFEGEGFREQGFRGEGFGEPGFGGESFRGEQGFGGGDFGGVQRLPQVVECVRNLVGPEQAERFARGEKPSIELEGKIRSCVDSFTGEMRNQQPVPSPMPIEGQYPQPYPGTYSPPPTYPPPPGGNLLEVFKPLLKIFF